MRDTRPPTPRPAGASSTDQRTRRLSLECAPMLGAPRAGPARRGRDMKIHSKPVEEHAEVPLADDSRWEAIVAHWQRREAPQGSAASDGNACYLLSVQRRGDAGDPHAQLAEIASLVRTQGDRVVGTEL